MDAKKHRTFGDLATDYCRQLTSCFAKVVNEVTKKVYECLLVFFDR
jgi:hypothetical protein